MLVHNFLVYRDFLLSKAEGFIPRYYVSFDRFKPIYVGSNFNNFFLLFKSDAVIVSANKFMNFLYKNFGFSTRMKVLAEKNPKLIHAHFGKGGAYALPIAEKLSIPLVVSFYGSDATNENYYKVGFVKSIFQRRLNRLKQKTDIFLCVSEHIKKVLIKRGFPRHKLVTHYVGIDLPEKRPKLVSKKSKEKQILFVGRMIERKGLSDLIKAMAIVQKKVKNVKLVIIGDGLEADYYKELSHKRKIKKCEFLGWVAPDQVKELLANSLMLCAPSKTALNGDSEGVPTIITESLLAGTPVVSTNHAGIVEVIDDGVNGFLGDEGDFEALAENIIKMYNIDDADYKKMQKSGLDILYEKFDAAKQSEKLQNIFKDLLENRGSIRPSLL